MGLQRHHLASFLSGPMLGGPRTRKRLAAFIWLPIVVACALPCMAMQLTAGPCAFSRGMPSLAHTCARGARRASDGAVMMGVTQTKMCECRAAQQRILSAPPFSRGSVEARATTRVAKAPRGAGRKCLHRSPRFRPRCSRGARGAGERGQIDVVPWRRKGHDFGPCRQHRPSGM